MPAATRIAIVAVLFFLSGVAGLSLQVLWLRQLSLFFGATSQATAVLLAAFMAGLALGGRYGGRLADRRRSAPLLLYGLCELGIGVAAICLPYGFLVADRWIAAADQAGFFPLAVRMALALVLLLPPTALMGATLPLVSRWLMQQGKGLSRGSGLLYAINTAGAVTGTLLCAVWWIPDLGLLRTSFLVLALNGSVGVFSILLARADTKKAPAQTAPARAPLSWTLVLLAAGIGFTALALEVVGTRILALFAGTTVYAFAAVLTTFLCGISLGSWLVLPLLRRSASACLRLVGLFNLGIAVALMAATAMVDLLPHLYLQAAAALSATHPHPLLLGLVVSPLLLLVPAALGGACFPLLVRAANREQTGGGTVVGHLYAANTIGAVGGSLLAGFVLVPQLGLRRSLLALAVLGAGGLVAGLALFAARAQTGAGEARWLRARAVWPVLIPALAVPFLPAWDPGHLAAGVYWRSESYLARDSEGGVQDNLDPILFNRRSLHHSEGLGATVDVFEKMNGGRQLAINGKIVASAYFPDVRLQMMMGGLGVLLHPDPREVLIIGLGTGMTAGAAAAHPAVQQVTVVELTPGVAEGAALFARWNGDLLSSPKLDLTFADGANFVRHTRRTFDVISSDPIHPFSAGSGTLYSREHFQAGRARLRQGGLFCQWLPLYQLSRPDLFSVLRTFGEVFPRVSLWFTGTDAVLLGSEAPVPPPEQMEAALRSPEMSNLLGPYGLDRPERILATWLADESDLRPLARNTPLNTVDRPFIEYSAPLAIPQYGILDNLEQLRSGGSKVPATWRGRDLGPYQEASRLVVKALASQGAATYGDLLGRAMQADPDDPFIRFLYLEWLSRLPVAENSQRLLQAVPMARSLLPAAELKTFWIKAALALASSGQPAGAFDLLDEIGSRLPGDLELTATKAMLQLESGRAEAAWQTTAPLFSGSALSPPSFTALLARYLAAGVTGRDQAAAALRPLFQKVSPAGVNPDARLARLLLAAGERERAVQAVRRAAAFRPGDPAVVALQRQLGSGPGEKIP